MKRSWLIKKRLNQSFNVFNSSPNTARKLCNLIFYVRFFCRGRPVQADLMTGNHFSKNKRYVYVSTPKVATTTILKFLRSQNNASPIDINGQIDKAYRLHPQIKSYFKFCFVRNPWARLYSCWFDKISTEVKFADIAIITRYKGIYPNMPFNDFVEWLLTEEGSDVHADRHWISQHKLLESSNGNLEYDFIGKLESFHSDINYVISKIGFDNSEIVDGNRFSSDSTKYRDMYDSSTRELVAKRYKKDIELFGYQF